MKTRIQKDPDWGDLLWMEDGHAEVAAALEFGIRIVHLSCAGMENLFYRQPEDLSDGLVTASGWRIYGGHRFWQTPESEQTYWPDNQPVTWMPENDGVLLIQEPDPWVGVQKSLRLRFRPDGVIALEHMLRNVSDHTIVTASWGVNTLAGGGSAVVEFPDPNPGVFTPTRLVSLWGETNLHDPRLQFSARQLYVHHLPLNEYLKIGLYSAGRAVLRNRDQRLELEFAARPAAEYPDFGCNFEVYLNRNVMELETLGVQRTLAPGEQCGHMEFWKISADTDSHSHDWPAVRRTEKDMEAPAGE